MLCAKHTKHKNEHKKIMDKKNREMGRGRGKRLINIKRVGNR